MRNSTDSSPPMGDRLEAKFLITTPMFLGGGDQEVDGIRPPSFKGALRFWWRAIYWGSFRRVEKEGPEGVTAALQKMHAREAKLFGLAAAKDVGGQGCFLLRVLDHPRAEAPPAVKNFGGAAYLRGMGIPNRKSCVPENKFFRVSLRFKPGSEESMRTEIFNALLGLGLMGGLGARTRRGCGSLALQEVKSGTTRIWKSPESVEEYKEEIARLFRLGAEDVSATPFSALSKISACWVGNEKARTGSELLEKVGAQLIRFRSNGSGRDGQRKILGKVIENPQSDCRFWSDHDLMATAANGQKISALPKRMVFGLPHNYFFSSTRKKIDIKETALGLERRASPFFIHIHSLNGSAIVLHLVLRARFLPADDKIIVGTAQIEASQENLQWREVLPPWQKHTGYAEGKING